MWVKDIYVNEAGESAVTLRFSFVSTERTLTKQELNSVAETIAAEFAKTGIVLK